MSTHNNIFQFGNWFQLEIFYSNWNQLKPIETSWNQLKPVGDFNWFQLDFGPG